MTDKQQTEEVFQTKTDFMPNITYKAGDNLIYFKAFDFLTGGRAFRVKDILMAIVEFVGMFVVLLIMLGTQLLFSEFKYAIFPSIVFVLIMLIIMGLTLTPKFDKNALSYTLNYGKSLRLKFHKKQPSSHYYDRFARIEPNGDIIYMLIGNGRMSELLFEEEKEAEREKIAVERNDLNGITVTNTKGFTNQDFKTQKAMIQDVIDSTKDEDLALFAKKSMLVYRKQLKAEKVERQFLTFKTHNAQERQMLSAVLENWQRANVLVVDERLSAEHIKEVFEEF